MRAGPKKYYLLMPQQVLNDWEIICDLIRPSINGFTEDYLAEIVSIVARHHRGTPTPLKMVYIKKMVPQGDKYMRGLIDCGIVIRSGNAIKGKTSYKYAFAPEYISTYKSILLNNPKLILRIERVQNEFQKNGAKIARGRSEQIPNLKKLTIDPGYKLYLSRFNEDVDKYNALISQVTMIENGQLFFNVDNTSGRFHSNVTILKKELRPFLRIDGKPLINIDLKNSQPYLSTIILTNPSKVSWMTTNPAFALLLQSLKVSHNHDVKKYISLVVSGQIYEYLMREFAKRGLELTRKETKTQVLRILFARNRKPLDATNGLARSVFVELFPTVHKIFSSVRGSERGDKEKSFKRFAILLQKIESYLILDVVLKRIYRELPGVIAITIHDSVMTGILTNHVEAVRTIIKEELTSFVGFAPQIKIENESPPISNEENNKKEEERGII